MAGDATKYRAMSLLPPSGGEGGTEAARTTTPPPKCLLLPPSLAFPSVEGGTIYHG